MTGALLALASAATFGLNTAIVRRGAQRVSPYALIIVSIVGATPVFALLAYLSGQLQRAGELGMARGSAGGWSGEGDCPQATSDSVAHKPRTVRHAGDKHGIDRSMVLPWGRRLNSIGLTIHRPVVRAVLQAAPTEEKR